MVEESQEAGPSEGAHSGEVPADEVSDAELGISEDLRPAALMRKVAILCQNTSQDICPGRTAQDLPASCAKLGNLHFA